MPMIALPITVNGVHHVFTETGENDSIQRQLITPCSAAIRISCSGYLRAGTSRPCMDSKTTPPAPATRVRRACGSGPTAALPGASPTTPPPTRDLYREEVHPTDPNPYRGADTWRRFEERIEEVQVRGGAPVQHVQRSTLRGQSSITSFRLFRTNGSREPPLAWRWVGQEHLDSSRSVAPGTGNRSAPRRATGR
jgi:hypothetical protein